MNRRQFLQATATPLLAAKPKLPNIVLILADDLGYGCLNCYGAETRHVRTPHIDRLAKEGIRFTDANTPSSVCSPTRYAIMTGRFCWRTSAKSGVLNTNAPLHIETTRLTMASMLKRKGYTTAAIGKWHLGYGTTKVDFTAPLTPGPLDIGFDYHFGVPQNHGDVSGIFVENRAVAGLRSTRLTPGGKTPYGATYLGIDAPQRVDDQVMDVLTQHAVDWIAKQKATTPFFLYYTPVAIHEPTTPSAKTKGTSGAGPYGDWIHDLDDSVGAVLKALDDNKLTKDTLVIFTSDNGAVLLTDGDRPEAVAYRAGMRVNGEWRGRKHSVYQGGFRVPFIVRWPGKALPTFYGKKIPKPFRDSMINHSAEGNFSIRQGPWKYIEGKPVPPIARVPAMRRAEMTPQLYNLKDDPKEQNNLIESHAEVAAKLKDLLITSRSADHTRRF
jgi:arylsulfatase A-like enzyme